MKNKQTWPIARKRFTHALRIAEEYCQAKNFELEHLRSCARLAVLVDMRQDVAKHLRGLGFSYAAIGYALNRDHTSVMHLCKDEMRVRKNRMARERYNNKYKFINATKGE